MTFRKPTRLDQLSRVQETGQPEFLIDGDLL